MSTYLLWISLFDLVIKNGKGEKNEMKKLNKILLLSLLSLTSVSGLVSCDGANSDVKIGVILVGDESEGYTLAHMNGIEDARKALGLREDQIIYKKKVEENNNCYVAAKELAEDGCSLIISNSYSHQDYVHQAAVEYPDITFVAKWRFSMHQNSVRIRKRPGSSI